MNKVNPYYLEKALQDSWSYFTSDSPDWRPDGKRCLGQSAATACVVFDYFAGDILRKYAKTPHGETRPHYYNMVGKVTYDFTEEQYSEGTFFTAGAVRTDTFMTMHDVLMSDGATRIRYEHLKDKVACYLANLPVIQ